ncbi:MAG TPA: tetratricopeptide repeat protein [Candidatus Polarisedimenticolia bacterium]|nr:tetratricopeptide repeat protein [Candidatus Polarisedimenticolia bacterium]
MPTNLCPGQPARRGPSPLPMAIGLLLAVSFTLRPGALNAETATATQPVTPYDEALELYKTEKFAEAGRILERELKTGPANAVGYLTLLGWCRYRQAQLEEARAAFESALKLAPDDADALEGRARAAARLGRSSDALDSVIALARLHPERQLDDVANQVLAKPGAQTDRRLSTERPAVATDVSIPSRARGDYFEVAKAGGGYSPIFVKGINMGVALPGKYPSEFPRDKETYLDWLGKIAAMGGNVVRLYTLLPPEFYQALHEHNAGRADGAGVIWLAQGVWTELPENDAYDDPGFTGQFLEEMERVIDAVHGNIAVAHRRGHAFGLYAADVSAKTLCYILGREWEPYSVAAYDDSRPHPADHRGEYFTLTGGTPTEAWIASVMDHAVAYEMKRYNAQRPVSFTNWPTLDPLTHPTEATKREEIAILKRLGLQQEPGTVLEYDNDGTSIDAAQIRPTSKTPAGTFASYHAYPYYPDFMNVDPGYLAARDRHGPSNYAGYLKELKAHHRDMPLLIAEFGVPTSRGIAHHQPQGWHHGGHTETEQGEIDARMFEEIHDSGCAGGILFAWLDEWFKKNWLVIAFEVPWDNKKNWLNNLDPEENYGLLGCKPGAGGWKIGIDGRGDDWRGVSAVAGTGAGPLRSLKVAHDEGYLYLRLDVDRLDWDSVNYVIGLDTYGASEGDHKMPFDLPLSTPTGMEFVADLRGPSGSRLLCDIPYDLHTNRFTRPWKSSENNDGLFIAMLAETNRRRVGRDGTVYPAIVYDRSPLRYGTTDAASPSFDDLADWYANTEEGFIEMRIGWNLLNVTDPSTRQVLDDPVPPRGGAGHNTTDGFRFYVAAYRPGGTTVLATLPAADARGRFASSGTPFYTWAPWEEPTYHTYLKKSYYILRDRLAPLEPLAPMQGGAR